jgi:hypothetical protein
VTIDSVTFRAPRFPKKFLEQIPHARFIECNYTRAHEFYRLHSKDTGEEAESFRESAASVLKHGKTYLDSIGVRFWMSSGTCLGELKMLGHFLGAKFTRVPGIPMHYSMTCMMEVHTMVRPWGDYNTCT